MIQIADDNLVVARLRPLSSERAIVHMPAGLTIAEMLDRLGLPRHQHHNMVVWIRDAEIDPAYYHAVRPKAGHLIVMRYRLQGGGDGKNILRSALLVVVAVLAAGAFGPGGAFPITSKLLKAAAIASVTVAASLAVNALIPPQTPNAPNLLSDAPTFSLTGVSNRANPFGTIPQVMGKHRMFPMLAAAPYTEIAGSDQYFRMLLTFGMGPLLIENIKIDETPIDNFDDVEYEVRQGYDADADVTLFTQDIQEDTLTVLLTTDLGWVTRVTEPDIDEISVDISFFRGLAAFTSDGKKVDHTVVVNVEYRLVGDVSWTDAGDFSVTEASTSIIRRSKRWTVTNGQYEVRLQRETAEAGLPNAEDVTWSAMRSIKCEDPTNVTGLSKLAIRIKATDQLNGVLQTVNAEVTSILPDWDGGTWPEAATSNPASIFRAILQSNANLSPLADAKLDLTTLATWHDECSAAGREFNHIFEQAANVYDALKLVAPIGRASPTIIDGLYSVVRDIAQATPVQVFTPRNSWGFHAQQVYADIPHGLRMQFINADAGWERDEIIVYDDGYDATNATDFEVMQLTGVTSPDQAWKLGRYHLAVARLRPEVVEINVDFEHLVCTRGDLVQVNHDVMLVGLGSGRINAVTTSGANATAVTLDETVTMATGTTYAAHIRLADGTVLTPTLTTSDGETQTLTFASPITPPIPEVGDLVAFGESGSVVEEYLVKAIDPQDELTARLTLVPEAPAVLTADTADIPAWPPQITIQSTIDAERTLAPIIDDVQSDEAVAIDLGNGRIKPRMVVTMGPVTQRMMAGGQIAYQGQIRAVVTGSNSNWRQIPNVPIANPEVVFDDVEEAKQYEFRIRTIDFKGRPSDWRTQTHTVVGGNTVPPDVDSMLVEGDYLVWVYSTPPRDLAGFRIKFVPGSRGRWGDALAAHDGLVSESKYAPAGLTAGGAEITWLIKAVDQNGNESANAISVTTNIDSPSDLNILNTQDEHALGFPGTIVDGTVSTDLIADAQAGAGDSALFWGQDPAAPFPIALEADRRIYWEVDPDTGMWSPNRYEQMLYTASYTPPLVPDRDTHRVTLDATFEGDPYFVEFRPVGSTDLMWSPDAAVDMWDASDAVIFWDTANEGTFTFWRGSLSNPTRQAYEFRVTTSAGQTRGKITKFQIKLDAPTIEEQFEDVTIPAMGARLPITKTYTKIIQVADIAIQADGGTAVAARVNDKHPSLGPEIVLFDSSGTSVAGLIDARVRGY